MLADFYLKIKKQYDTIPLPLKASFWFFVCSFLQKGMAVITTPVFTRLLSAAEYGQYNVFYSWMSILSIFVSLNLSAGVYIQGLVKFESQKRAYSSSLQGLTLTLLVCWLLLYVLFRSFWNGLFSLTTLQMLAMFGLIWLSAVFNFWSVEQRVELHYQRLILLTLLVSLLQPAVGIVLVFCAEDKVTARILGMLAVQFVACFWLFFVQMRRGKIFFSRFFWKHALTFNLPLIPHYLSQSVLSSSDRIMVERIVGADAAGIYSLAYSISLIMTMLNTSLMSTIEPWLYKTIRAKRIGDLSRVVYPVFVLVAAANLVVIALAPEIVALFAPAEYYDAIQVIPPVTMSVYFMFAYTFFAVFEFYYEKTKYIAIATVGGAILNIVLNALLIPVFGYVAAGYTTLLCYILYAAFHYFFMRKICRMFLDGIRPYNTRILVMITALFLLVGFLFLLLYPYRALRYAILAAGCIGVWIERKRLQMVAGQILNLRKEE